LFCKFVIEGIAMLRILTRNTLDICQYLKKNRL